MPSPPQGRCTLTWTESGPGGKRLFLRPWVSSFLNLYLLSTKHVPSTVEGTVGIINNEEKHKNSCPRGAYGLSVFGDTPREKGKVGVLLCKITSSASHRVGLQMARGIRHLCPYSTLRQSSLSPWTHQRLRVFLLQNGYTFSERTG